MKSKKCKRIVTDDLVAPFAGAWIEILDNGRVLKADYVAPFAGAWIEIIGVKSSFYGNYVAPFAGAWIEITCYTRRNSDTASLPSRERGLKYYK